MASASLLTLLDDIVVILDDCFVMTKLSAKKTAGILGDDLALNTEQMVGLRPERELPVIWAVAKGSAKNKAILIPLALALRAFAPGLIPPLLMAGGAFLCFEGVEKILHRSHKDQHAHAESGLVNEPEKIQGAIRTDFILSAEIIAITLGIVAQSTLLNAFLVLLFIGLLMTVGVYGFVALIVKVDDLGLHLMQSPHRPRQQLGALIMRLAPRFIQLLSWVGTLAIFSVGGGIIVHGIPVLHHFAQGLSPFPLSMGFEALVGVVVGALIVGIVHLWKRR
jgi:predicted DNA repair protein MutK